MAFQTSEEENLFGKIESSQANETLVELTLDEPVSETLMRDLKSIWSKAKLVLYSTDSEEARRQLQDWDLWGPLLFCLTLGLSLSVTTNSKETGDIFALVFSLFWLGSGVVTLNAKLLQGQISFFQTLCVIGYCLFPLTICSFILAMLVEFNPSSFGSTFEIVYDLIRIFVVLACWLWATKSVRLFLSQSIHQKKRLLAVYPAFLLYSAFAWMLLT